MVKKAEYKYPKCLGKY